MSSGGLQLIQLASSQIKQDDIRDFIISSNNNSIALLGSTNELFCMELILKPDCTEIFPYAVNYIQIPSDNPCTEMLSSVDLIRIYDSCNIQQSQEFALDPLYVGHISIEKPKVHVVDMKFSNFSFGPNRQPLVAILNSYGSARVFSKSQHQGREWNTQILNISDLYKFLIFPQYMVNAHTNNYQMLKSNIQHFLITALEWDADHKLILYTANAAGYVIAFKYDEASNNFIEYFRLASNLERINYLKNYGQFLLVGNNKGMLQLYKIQHATGNEDIAMCIETANLCTKADRMSCSKAEITFIKNENVYFVVLCKAAHILGFVLNAEGEIIAKNRYYVGDLKLSALEVLNESQFIVGTITGAVHIVNLKYLFKASCLQMECIAIKTPDLDSGNLQIKGIATSKNHNLITLVLHRNKEYTYASKNPESLCFISICKLSNRDTLSELDYLNILHMDICLDYAVQIRLDILNAFKMEQYQNYCNLLRIEYPRNCSDDFIKKLQIKLLIVEAQLQYQRYFLIFFLSSDYIFLFIELNTRIFVSNRKVNIIFYKLLWISCIYSEDYNT